MNKLPQNDPIRANQRKSTAARRVREKAQCACGEARPEALIVGTNPIICYECRKRKRGQSVIEDHHFAGQANSDITIAIPGNDHRAELSVAQYDWPKQTLQNPDSSPLLVAAASIRGFIDTVLHLIEKGLQWIAEMLEKADLFFKERCGPKWWVGTPLEKFQPKGFCHAH